MKSTNPWSARVVAEISLEDAVAAIEHFVEYLPADRFSTYISDRLFTAAEEMERKADAYKKQQRDEVAAKKFTEHAETFITYGTESGRIDCSKENPCFESVPSGLLVSRQDDDVFNLDGRFVCRECKATSNPEGPRVHRLDCSRFGKTVMSVITEKTK